MYRTAACHSKPSILEVVRQGSAASWCTIKLVSGAEAWQHAHATVGGRRIECHLKVGGRRNWNLVLAQHCTVVQGSPVGLGCQQFSSILHAQLFLWLLGVCMEHRTGLTETIVRNGCEGDAVGIGSNKRAHGKFWLTQCRSTAPDRRRCRSKRVWLCATCQGKRLNTHPELPQ